MTRKNKRGFAFVATLFIVLTMTFLAITTSTLIPCDAIIAVKNYQSAGAFYIASSGVEYYLKQLDGDDDWSTPPVVGSKSFSGGVFSVATTDEAKNQITFTVTGITTVGSTTYTRGLRSTVQRSIGGLGGIAEDYAIYVGDGSSTGDTNIGANVTINGDIMVGGDLDLGSNTTISGDAFASGEVTGDTTGVTGSAESNAEMPEDPPALDTAYFKEQIAIALDIGQPGLKRFQGIETISGTYYYKGNVEFKVNCEVIITGIATVVAGGKCTVYNNTTIGDNFTMICDGWLWIDNNVTIGRYGLWYSDYWVTIANNADIGDTHLAEGTQVLCDGDIQVGNNCSFDGLMVCDTVTLGNNTDFSGLLICDTLTSVGENSTISINPDVIDWDTVTAVDAGESVEYTDVTDWDEVY